MKRKYFFFVLLSLGVVFFPLALLFMNVHVGFTSDWYNSLWMTGNMSHYFKTQGVFPITLSTDDFVGITFPIFYGHLLYPFLGVLAVPFGPNWAIRLCCLFVYFAQFFTVYKVTQVFTGQRAIGLIVSVLMLWSLYPLSNLYSRSALPEFIAFSLLVSCVCFWYLVVAAAGRAKKLQYWVFFTFFLTFLLGVHPITAIYGGMTVGFSVLFSFYLNRPNRSDLKFYLLLLGVAGVFAVLTEAPWVVAYLKFRTHLLIAVALGTNSYLYGVDHWWVRLLPFPFDYRSLSGGMEIPTTYLDTQMNVPLGILLLWLMRERFLGRRWSQLRESRVWHVSLLCLFLSFLFLMFSVFSSWANLFTPILKYFQMAYRMVNYTNVFILLGIFSILQGSKSSKSVDSVHYRVRDACVKTFILTVSFCSVFLKLFHGSVVWSEGSRFNYAPLVSGDPTEFIKVPKSFYSLSSYAICDDLPLVTQADVNLKQTLQFKVSTGPAFGRIAEVQQEVIANQWILTNVYPFPWNEIRENGQLISRDRLACYYGSPKIAVRTLNSGIVRFSFHEQPSRQWLILHKVSQSVFWIFLVFVCSMFALNIVRRLRCVVDGSA